MPKFQLSGYEPGEPSLRSSRVTSANIDFMPKLRTARRMTVRNDSAGVPKNGRSTRVNAFFMWGVAGIEK